MRVLLHVPLRDDGVGFCMVTEVPIRREDVFDRRQVRAREERVGSCLQFL